MQKKSKFLVFLWIIVWLNMIFYWQILLWQFDFWYPYSHRCVSFLEPFSGSCCGWSCGLGTLPEVGGCCKEGFGRFVGEIGCALLQLHRKTSNWHHSNVDSRRSPRRLWRRQIKKRWVWYGNALAPWFFALPLFWRTQIFASIGSKFEQATGNRRSPMNLFRCENKNDSLVVLGSSISRVNQNNRNTFAYKESNLEPV